MALDLTFTDEQEMLRDAVRSLCADLCPPARVRELEDDPVGYDTELWRQFGALDLTGLLVPEQHGGYGSAMLEACVLYEELGRSLAPTPHFVSAVLAAGALGRAGSAEQQGRWLPRLASGETVMSVAWLEPNNSFGPRGVQARAVADGAGHRITGTKWHVAFASSAERLVVLARTGDGDTDVDLFLVDPAADGVTMDQQVTIGGDTQYAVRLDGVAVGADDRVGGPQSGWATWDETMADGALLAAAQACGGARHSLDITVQYAKDRHQFGKPLGAFQALAHDMADANTAVDGATTLAREAAWARSEGRDVHRLAPMAKLFACRTYRDVTATAQQIFGGVGFTLEYDIQLYFRRAKQLQLSWWDSQTCEARIAASVLDADTLTI
jgi:alkylation response protein AidB-like acyl-CoA dehydrogenase